uniref:chitinase n=1 Tax=Hirsutella thompsonii TaxID=42368 RepID=A0A097F8P9_HIRTH|nr:chitinase [Hirsutella thompsonii]
MSLFRTSLAFLVALQTALGLASSLQSANSLQLRSEGYVNMVYWPHWANKKLSEIDAKDVTHIMYAFGKVFPDGSVQLIDPITDVGSVAQSPNVGGKWEELFRFKQANPHVKTVLSIGGWPREEEKTWFASAASTPENRERFAKMATKLMLDGGFDGLDIDWEFPTGGEESKSHAELMKALRQELDELSKTHENYHFLLTLATSASPWWHQHLSYNDLVPLLDYWYIMAYDYTGGWGEKLQHNANLYPSKTHPDSTVFNTDQGIKSLTNKYGVPKDKIVLGIPSYGHVFVNVKAPGDKKKSTDHVEPRSLNRINLDDLDINCDTDAVACVGYNRKTKELITLDTAKMVAVKGEYVQKNGLAGMFMWDLSHDLPGDDALHVAAANSLGRLERSPSLQKYPDSRYANVKGVADPKTSSPTSPMTTPTMPTSGMSSPVSTPATSKPMTTSRPTSIMTTTKKPVSSAPSIEFTSKSLFTSSKPVAITTSARAKTSSVHTTQPAVSSSPFATTRKPTTVSTPVAHTTVSLPATHSSGFPTVGRFWGNQTTSMYSASKIPSSLPVASDLASDLNLPESNQVVPTKPAADAVLPVVPSAPTNPGSEQHQPTPSQSQNGPSSSVAANVACPICELPDYMTPAINADGMVTKTVFAVVIKHVTIACSNMAICAPPSPVAVTQSVFVTVCPMDLKPSATTVSIGPSAGAEPLPVTVADRVVSMCVTELGCRATDVPAPSAPGKTIPRPGSAQSGASRVFSVGKNQPGGPKHLPAAEQVAPAQGDVKTKAGVKPETDVELQVGVQAKAGIKPKVGAPAGAVGANGNDEDDSCDEVELPNEKKPIVKSENKVVSAGSGSLPSANRGSHPTQSSNDEVKEDAPSQAPRPGTDDCAPEHAQSDGKQGAVSAQIPSGHDVGISARPGPKAGSASTPEQLTSVTPTVTATLRPAVNTASSAPVKPGQDQTLSSELTAGAMQVCASAWAVLAVIAVLL